MIALKINVNTRKRLRKVVKMQQPSSTRPKISNNRQDKEISRVCHKTARLVTVNAPNIDSLTTALAAARLFVKLKERVLVFSVGIGSTERQITIWLVLAVKRI